MSPEKAVEVMNSINEEAAMMQAMQGNGELLQTLNKALVALGHSPVESPI
jgi:hypothetical protein